MKDTGHITVNECLILEQVPTLSIVHNTVLPVTERGIIKHHAYSDNLPPQVLPLDTFRVDARTGRPTYAGMSDRVVRTKLLIDNLQKTAAREGVPHWIFLKNRDKPPAWKEGLVQQHSAQSGDDDVQVKGLQDMPDKAKNWIEQRIRQMERDGTSRLDETQLMAEVRAWVQRNIKQARENPGVVEGAYGVDGTTELEERVQQRYMQFVNHPANLSQSGEVAVASTSAATASLTSHAPLVPRDSLEP
jgi:hypothetical protein